LQTEIDQLPNSAGEFSPLTTLSFPLLSLSEVSEGARAYVTDPDAIGELLGCWRTDIGTLGRLLILRVSETAEDLAAERKRALRGLRISGAFRASKSAFRCGLTLTPPECGRRRADRRTSWRRHRRLRFLRRIRLAASLHRVSSYGSQLGCRLARTAGNSLAGQVVAPGIDPLHKPFDTAVQTVYTLYTWQRSPHDSGSRAPPEHCWKRRAPAL
jgi:hypothetical protein